MNPKMTSMGRQILVRGHGAQQRRHEDTLRSWNLAGATTTWMRRATSRNGAMRRVGGMNTASTRYSAYTFPSTQYSSHRLRCWVEAEVSCDGSGDQQLWGSQANSNLQFQLYFVVFEQFV